VLVRRREADTWVVLYYSVVGRTNVPMRDFVNVQSGFAWSKFVPQLSRSSLQIGHIKHNMQRMHMRFC
jgi:hypothetical protein